MLQKHSFDEQSPDASLAHLLRPAYYIGIAKRRWLHFSIPFILVLAIGSIATLLWPAVYLAEGKILVESQQIPSELVRPTVTALANERIQVIEQRIMTRDNLLGIANKFNMFPDRSRWSGTDILDFMRARTQIKPLELRIPIRQSNRQTIAFTVGFEHEQPAIAARVANELMTMILSEDVRTRTNFASETTRFLERESKRLEAELTNTEARIAELKRRHAAGPARPMQPGEVQLATLRAELLQKSTIFSANHPEIKALKQRIAALETIAVPQPQDAEVGLEVLERQQAALEKNLELTNQKLTAARLGESLERGQQSERLEVIEQPTLPHKPIRPNRGKLLALVFLLAIGAGGGLALLKETTDNTIRRTSDIFSIVDPHLVVAIPYIETRAEVARTRKLRQIAIIGGGITALVIVAVAIFFMPSISDIKEVVRGLIPR